MEIDSFDFELDGASFRASVIHDSDMGTPWDNEDGHGPVSDWERRAKAPNEIVLVGDGRGRLGTDAARRFYDFAEAVRIAKRDSWGWLPSPVIIEADAGEPYAKRGGRATCEAANLSVYDPTDLNRAVSAVYAAVRDSMTAGEYAAKAALADFERLRAFCNDSWHYVGVQVSPLCECCGKPDESRAASLWGIESGCAEFIRETARELVAEIEPCETWESG